MPIGNDKDKIWVGWLTDGLGGREADCQQALARAIEERQIPKTTVQRGTVNMWWRPQSQYIDVICELDGKITATIHVQPFGSGLWIGRAADGNWITDNYYKRMAATAFLETVDRCIGETLETMSGGLQVRKVEEQPAVKRDEPARLHGAERRARTLYPLRLFH